MGTRLSLLKRARLVRRWVFEVYRDRAGEWRWRLKAANGEIVADSAEGYVEKAGAKVAVAKVKLAAPNAQVKCLG